MNLPPRSGSAARSSSTRARAPDSGCASAPVHAPDSDALPVPVVPAEWMRPHCRCCGGDGTFAPTRAHALRVLSVPGGADLSKASHASFAMAAAITSGVPPAVPSAGGCREPLRTASLRHVTASLE
eukprot:4115196-Prymnesium_polylepis.1